MVNGSGEEKKLRRKMTKFSSVPNVENVFKIASNIVLEIVEDNLEEENVRQRLNLLTRS